MALHWIIWILLIIDQALTASYLFQYEGWYLVLSDFFAIDLNLVINFVWNLLDQLFPLIGIYFRLFCLDCSKMSDWLAVLVEPRYKSESDSLFFIKLELIFAHFAYN